MWQASGGGKAAQETPLAEAAYGQPTMGMLSALVRDWSYSLALAQGADAALVACMLCIYTDLVEFNAGMALFNA